jgi:hypothetical protein
LNLRGNQLIAWALAAGIIVLALLYPAFWIGFPVVFYDTGGYLDSYMSGELFNGRSALYGFFLRLGMPTSFWGNIVFQAAMVVWMLILTLRAHGFGGRPLLALLIGLGLAVFTSAPWYAAQLMPDIWHPLSVLAFYLLAFRGEALRRWEKIALLAIVAFGMAGHMSTLGLGVGLAGALALWAAVAPRVRWPRPALAMPVLAVAAGIFLSLFSNLAITGRFAFTPGGPNFIFGRLITTGIATRYLAEHCPDPELRVCDYRDQIKTDGDAWLWSSESPLWKMGGWEAFEDQARHIIAGSLRDYPLMHLRAALEGALWQVVLVKTGDGISQDTWHTHGVLEQHAPRFFPAFLAARQQKNGFDFTWLNVVHVPVALAATAGLPVVILLAARRRLRRSQAVLAGTVLIALLGNAAICGTLSNPHDRYQNRLVWLAPLALVIAALGRRPAAKPA